MGFLLEILNQAKAGLHSSIDDPKELAQKIIAILDDQEKVKEMGENGRRYFLERFERKKVTREWANLLVGWMINTGWLDEFLRN